MHNNKAVKFILFSLALAGFLGFAAWRSLAAAQPEPKVSCLGIPVAPAEESYAGETPSQRDYYNQIFFEGERVALDRESRTIYISQNIDENTGFQDLKGTLEIQNPFCSLSFLYDPMLEDLDTAVSQGHTFTLLVQEPFSGCSEYSVVFTTFPVIRMDGSFSHLKEDGRKVNLGDFCVWNGERQDSGGYSTKSAMTYWNVRGGLTTDFDKKSWKLSLVDKKRQKNDMSFFGLDADDDWILNALVMDDTKMRDKFCMDFWNSQIASADHNPKMSDGSYVELVLNGEYSGIYTLQRRIDAKYLQLDTESDILMKGRPSWVAEETGTAYEVQSSFLSEQDSCTEITNAVSGQGNYVDLSNFIDLTLFLQMTCGLDNCVEKNMFYVLYGDGDDFRLSWVPWDMDLTFGNLSVGTPARNYDTALNAIVTRQEENILKQYIPDLDLQLAQRWQALRSTVYSEDALVSLYHQVQNRLSASGALIRDQAVWGLVFEGEDTPEQILQFIHDRLVFLDAYYAGILANE